MTRQDRPGNRQSVERVYPGSGWNANRPSDWRLNFFAMWTGQAFSLLGSRVAQFALVWWLTQETGSATVLATATLVALLPEVLLSPIAGAYVDRWKRQWVIFVADYLVALAALWLAYLFLIEAVQVWHVYVLIFVRAVAGSFHLPAVQASTSLMVPEKHLTRVAGLNQSLGGVLTIAGPPLAALLMGLIPLYAIMMIDVGTAALALIPLLFVFVPQPKRESVTGAKSSIWSDLVQGFNYIRGWRGLWILIGAAMIIKIAMTPAFSLLPLLVSDHFQGEAAQLGLVQAITGIGLLVGGLTLSVWGGFRRRIFTTLIGMIGLGLGLLALGLVPADKFGLALVTSLLIGLTIPLVDGPLMAIMQATVDPEKQGRVFTLIISLFSITSPIGLIVAGPLSDLIGLQFWYITAGLVCVLVAITLLFFPAVIHIEEGRESG